MLKEKIDNNSRQNQSIKRDFVAREVYCCASSLIYQLQEDGHYQDEILEFSLKDEIKEEDLKGDIIQDYIEELAEWIKDKYIDGEEVTIDDLDKEELKELAYDLNINVDDYLEPCEALEHWIVSDWLADKLEAYGELVTKDFLGLTIWGRACSGQAILLDWVISKICNDLDMLK